MSICEYLNSCNIEHIEGNSGDLPSQTARLQELSCNLNFKYILEIGFNAGHSADSFLSSSLAHVTSFDIQMNPYIDHCKKYIDRKYPTRHTLIIGDSKETIPLYAKLYPNAKFDLIFIDGDHSFEGAFQDIINCKQLAHKDTLLIIDDVIVNSNAHAEFTVGPTNACREALNNNIIELKGFDSYQEGRGMIWGSYCFP